MMFEKQKEEETMQRSSEEREEKEIQKEKMRDSDFSLLVVFLPCYN